MKKKNTEKIFMILVSIICIIVGCFLIYAVDIGWEAAMLYFSIWAGIDLLIAGIFFLLGYITGYFDD